MVALSATSTSTNRQMKRRSRLAISAPGSSPGLAQYLEPVADPEHGKPTGGGPLHLAINGENRAMAPVRR